MIDIDKEKDFFLQLWIKISSAIEGHRYDDKNWREIFETAFAEVFEMIDGQRFEFREAPIPVPEPLKEEWAKELQAFWQGLCFGNWAAYQRSWKFQQAEFHAEPEDDPQEIQ